MSEAELETYARTVAAAIDLPLDDICLPGVVANLALVFRHAAAFMAEDLPDATDPAALISP